MERRELRRRWRISQGYEPNRVLGLVGSVFEININRADHEGFTGSKESLDLLLKDVKSGQVAFNHTPLYVRTMDPIGSTVQMTVAEKWFVFHCIDGKDFCNVC